MAKEKWLTVLISRSAKRNLLQVARVEDRTVSYLIRHMIRDAHQANVLVADSPEPDDERLSFRVDQQYVGWLSTIRRRSQLRNQSEAVRGVIAHGLQRRGKK
jgi:hypothetical protein